MSLRDDRMKQLILFFVVVFAGTLGMVALLLAAPGLFGEATLGNPLVVLGVYFPSLTSIALTAILEGRAGLGRLLRRINPLGFNPVWYLVVLLGLPLVIALGVLVTGGRPSFVGLAAALTAAGVALLLDPGPIGEEFGWRGYALPRLLERFSPFTATLILGVVWATWHLPAFFMPGMPQSELNLGIFYLGAVTASMVMTWVALNTAGSILLAILIHLMLNHGGDAVGASFNQTTMGTLIASIAIWAFVRKRFFLAPGLSAPSPAARGAAPPPPA